MYFQNELRLVIAISTFLYYTQQVCSLTCVEINDAGKGAKFSPDDLQTLSRLSPSEIEPCLVLLGIEILDYNQASSAWRALTKVYGSASDIPEEKLRLLGWVISGIPPVDFQNISLTDVDTIAAFGQFRNLSAQQLAALRDNIFSFWSTKSEEDLTSFDLMNLRQVVCALNASAISNIHPQSYRDAAHELATVRNCPQDIITALANLAVNEAAFGNPMTWNSNKVSAVGCVIAGLPDVKMIPAEAMQGITPDIVYCLPQKTTQEMTPDQLEEFSAESAKAMSSSSAPRAERLTQTHDIFKQFPGKSQNNTNNSSASSFFNSRVHNTLMFAASHLIFKINTN
ncbi:otoancorin-like [Nilaparvata lugens]|uniref:otoancorin-like n=1 Tax=Nilaparvata lugens TaxID=108931 RepID=UPI00193D275A|nr:otoancorin-like [Nilaparvata lugens]